MPLTDDEIKSALDILKALDGAIDKGPWEHNLFFKGIGKKLRDARDKFKEELGLDELTADLLTQNHSKQIDNQTTEVYISLYQAEGSSISKWTTVVNSLAGYNLTRPVYRNETDIQAAIRSKEQQQNDAYVAVRVRNIDIMKPALDMQPTDKLGHELLILREGAVHLENISRFVHKTGQYQFRNKLLSKV